MINYIFLLAAHLCWSSVPSELSDEYHLVRLIDCSLISRLVPSPFLILLFLIVSHFQHLKRIKPMQYSSSLLKNTRKEQFSSLFPPSFCIFDCLLQLSVRKKGLTANICLFVCVFINTLLKTN